MLLGRRVTGGMLVVGAVVTEVVSDVVEETGDA